MSEDSEITLFTAYSGRNKHAAVMLRFARAKVGPPSLRAPDLDDHGFVASTDPEDQRPARGPVVGMTLGGSDIRVRVVRERIGPRPRLFVKKTLVSGSDGHLTILSPSSGHSLNAPDAGFLVDHIHLRSAFTTTASDPGDAAWAADEAENERVLVVALAGERTRLVAALEARARAWNGAPKNFRANAGETQLQALIRNMDLQRPIQYDRITSPDNRTALAYLDWLDRVRGEITAAQTQIDELSEYLEDQGDALDADAVVASATPLQARVDAALARIQRRRAASQVNTPSLFKLEVHIGSASGPLAGELGVVVFPIKEVEVQPNVISLGARGQDDTHLQFDQVPPAGQSYFDYPKLLLILARTNVVYAPAGVRLYVRSRARVKRFRIADAADLPNTAIPADDPDGWNTYMAHFNDLFPTPGVFFSRNNNVPPPPPPPAAAPAAAPAAGPPPAGGAAAAPPPPPPPPPPAPSTIGRKDIWANVVMNAHTSEELGRLNVYFVRKVTYGFTGNDGLLGLGYGSRAQTGTAGPVTLNRMARVAVTTPPGRPQQYIYGEANPLVPFAMNLGDDRIGLVVGVESYSGTAWTGSLAFARVIAHEIMHCCNVSHYRGAEQVGPNPIRQNLWSHRNLMFNFLYTVEGDGSQAYSRAVGYGADSTGTFTGAMLTMKKHPDPPADVGPYSSGTRQVGLMRETFLHMTYWGHV